MTEHLMWFIIGWILGNTVYEIYKWNKLNKWMNQQDEFKKYVETFSEIVAENLEYKTILINYLLKKGEKK